MIKTIIKNSLMLVAPTWTETFRQTRWSVDRARQLRKDCDACSSLEQIVETVMAYPWFPSTQKKTEILSLLKELQRKQPKRACEIGAFGGGTLSLFSAVASPAARILSSDIDYKPSQLKVYPKLEARTGQKIHLLKSRFPRSTKRWIRLKLACPVRSLIFFSSMAIIPMMGLPLISICTPPWYALGGLSLFTISFQISRPVLESKRQTTSVKCQNFGVS